MIVSARSTVLMAWDPATAFHRARSTEDVTKLTMLSSALVQLRSERFDKLFQSPLRRSFDTATIIWGNRNGKVTTLPSLREIDLYNFQVSKAAFA